MAVRSALTSCPKSRATPRDGLSSVASTSIVVVLPGAVRAEQPDDRAGGNLEIERVERAGRSVVAPEPDGFDGRRARAHVGPLRLGWVQGAGTG